MCGSLELQGVGEVKYSKESREMLPKDERQECGKNKGNKNPRLVEIWLFLRVRSLFLDVFIIPGEQQGKECFVRKNCKVKVWLA